MSGRKGAAEDRQTTVLFADVTGSMRLYEAAGDGKAAEAIGECMRRLRLAAEASGGRVVKTMGDEVMVLFPTPDHAADAATRMHAAVGALPAVEGQKLALRIGFHAGPVIQRDSDVFGDTVNLASRLAEQATRGQVLTSANTVSMLTPYLQHSTRRLYDIAVKGKPGNVALCEVLWSKSPDITDFPLETVASPNARLSLRLKFRGRELVRRRLRESITVGRDPQSALVVRDAMASRHHCVIERRQDRFFVRDHSSNGTYVRIDGEQGSTLLRREEAVLRGHGWLGFGQAAELAGDVLEYLCVEEHWIGRTKAATRSPPVKKRSEPANQ